MSKDPIRELLRQESTALAAKVVSGETLAAEEISALDLLARLIEIRNSTEPPRRNWWAGGMLACTLVIVSLLLFARVPETDVELDLTVSGLRFVLAREQVIAGAMRVSQLGASGLGEVQLPAEAAPHPRSDQSPSAGRSGIRVSVNESAKRPGVATLAPLALCAGTAVGLQPLDGPREYALSIHAPGTAMRADVNGTVNLALAGFAPWDVEFRPPRPILLRAGPNDVDLNVTFPASTPSPFSPQLSIRDLSLFRIDEFTEGNRSLVRRTSTVLSGTLFLESINGEERKVRPGEALQFEKSDGEIRELRLSDSGIGLRYRGRVRGMMIGSGEGLRSLMPTYLEWLRARHGLSLLWGTAVYLFGFIAGALKWWGIRI
jgi:hypothetical protein